MKTEKNMPDHDRRNFLKMTSTLAGAAALSAMGFAVLPDEKKNRVSQVDVNGISTDEVAADVLVAGSGMAGLFAAVKAHDAGAKVIMVTKGRLGASGQTPFARGIFSFDPATAGVTLDQFVEKVSTSAISTSNPIFTRKMAEHSKARVDELRQWGFFESPLYHKSFSVPVEKRNIPVIERVMLTHLVKENGRIAGAAGFSLDEEKVIFFSAKSVVLCTGAGGFKPNGFPINDLTHDGTMMAYKLGARVTGKEWNDGHPGKMENPASVFSQWGGMLEGPPFVTGVSIRHDLGVDMNYRAYIQGPDLKEPAGPPKQGRTVDGGPYRPAGFDNPDPGQHDEAHGGHHGPPAGRGKKNGPPPGMGGITVGGASAGMSIHKAEGLVPVDEYGLSDIAGLYAAGDALGSYMAGAIYTQIGSSLVGSAVQGAMSGEAAAGYAGGIVQQKISAEKRWMIKEEIIAPLKRERGYSPAWVTQTLQSIMIPNFILYIKKEPLLRAALAYVEELRDMHQPKLVAADMHELRLAHETGNMILNAEMKLRASIERKESRCSHYRLDYPDVDSKNWQCWINISQGEQGQMILEKQPFSQWPAG